MIKPEFVFEYYLPQSWKKVALETDKILTSSMKSKLKLIAKVRIPYDGTLIKIFIDDEDAVYYYSPTLFSGITKGENLIDKNGQPAPNPDKTIQYTTPGYGKIAPFVSLTTCYRPIELRSLIVESLWKSNVEVSCKYEDILVACIQAVKKYREEVTKC